MSAAYLLLTLMVTGLLLLLLSRPGAARAMTVWSLAALLPLLCALSAALSAQGRAARVLATAAPQDTQVTVTTGGAARTLMLSAQDAACVERAVYLNAHVTLDTAAGPLPLGPGTRVTGPLPSRAAVEAQVIRGTLRCPHLHAVRTH
ncbi:uncharacterized SAM-binding protein YcdF (DUF218 family) [Deinococcus metalli]|uniref:Uncharacterized SAM-binding protein YcdF (DUF218 family) n=1 Tax=Deinococcus metalli TaxID=1141878 RepID=A0A7W8NPY8_9DEIO|nr:hypothetical protein [Deinococcus metalli]MBB5377331.1 uncharacterized SAM-binding protein YcdF (DUF218 family) [Deinococcus metalli]GHF49695.1 hypothetical protein GCM10017781_27580 [Deinococcus metalli]